MNGFQQGRGRHDHRFLVWLVLAALCTAALGSAPSAVQTDEPPDPPNLRGSFGQLEESPFEAPDEDTLDFETYNIRGDLSPVVPYIIGGRPAEPDTFSWQVDLGGEIKGHSLILELSNSNKPVAASNSPFVTRFASLLTPDSLPI